MDDKYLIKALQSLRAGSEFTLSDGDYSTIEWHVLEGIAPTQAQIDAEIVKIKAKEEADKTAKAAEKAALLERLGITAEEATLLLG
jgi:hypothetical protein